ncbi:MAG: 16S rRNA (guanine(966)-N(2))-methyltransferase RsmD [Oscillospiraceae bacterium]|nr:16S rRNA (guanine(966)-N(2))-methyltransferase RsmD [Oscillospiraceae bacterium]
MRVIAGTAKGRRLSEPEGMDIRPTTDNVKESIFNIIQFDIEGASVLDMFAGTGQLGIEALSRGAEKAVFLDRSRKALNIVQRNLETAGFSDRARLFCTDSLQWIGCGEKFDIVVMDPPYDGDILEKALSLAISFDILADDGIIVCESRSDKTLTEPDSGAFKKREYRYGKIKISMFIRNNN